MSIYRPGSSGPEARRKGLLHVAAVRYLEWAVSLLNRVAGVALAEQDLQLVVRPPSSYS